MTVSSFDEITTDKPEKSLTVRLTKTGGRNQQGKLTVRHRGGGHKRLYRIIDFKRTKDGIPARVATIEYDPNRSARIALLNYADGEKRYILAPNGLKVGDKLKLKGNPEDADNVNKSTEEVEVEIVGLFSGENIKPARTRVELV